MKVRCAYSVRDQTYDFPDELWPHDNLAEQARIAIGLWVGNKLPNVRWNWVLGPQPTTVDQEGFLCVDIGGSLMFRFQPSEIGGPW